MKRDKKTREGIENEKYSMSSITLTCITPPTKYKRTQMTSVETSSTISNQPIISQHLECHNNALKMLCLHFKKTSEI